MRPAELSFLIFYFLFYHCEALNCRSDGGWKNGELKKIYNVCLKQQGGGNNINSRNNNEEWQSQRNSDRSYPNNIGRNRGEANTDTRVRDTDHNDEENNLNNRHNLKNKMRDQNRNVYSGDDRMVYKITEENDDWYSKDERQSRNDNNKFQKPNGVNGRDDFFQREDFGYSTQYSTQPTRRYKRERRVEMNSGKRSQYNPNPQRFSVNEERYEEEEEKKSSENNSTMDDKSKACALHCLLENLRMTGEDGMPDRYLVTHTITKDLKDEDLKDFLQEAIEECFQILDNENSEDKCQFSNNLLLCFSEKGKENCDDWKDDFQF